MLIHKYTLIKYEVIQVSMAEWSKAPDMGQTASWETVGGRSAMCGPDPVFPELGMIAIL
jgi:hypothetical protein